MKETGILLPVSSLPSSWGVGELGSTAYEWIDILQKNQITVWQILPLNPTGFGNSPYQPYSSYAGDELYISLEELQKEGLLRELPPAFEENAVKIKYEQVRQWKEAYLRKAYEAFHKDEAYEEFARQEWPRLYGTFRALKKENENRCWNEWPENQRNWPQQKGCDLQHLEEEINYHIFLQYLFISQWMKVKAYANERNISIMGDVPFYVGLDSVDVWAGKENFLLDAESKPVFIAGVPPDYFSATGQRWGNPIYDWKHLKETKYQFWVERMGYNQKLFDMVRIDHFRAFDTFWKIPATCQTAVEGEWIEAPGYEVLDTLNEKLPGIHLVAEDLGDLRPEVLTLKEHYHLKGMKILQFTLNMEGKYAFDGFRDSENMIIYSGTHDNGTLREWYESQTKAKRRKLRKWLKEQGFTQGSVTERLIAYTLSSAASYAVIPAFDILDMGSEGRLNTPGTVGSPNWEWKLADLSEFEQAIVKYRPSINKRFTEA